VIIRKFKGHTIHYKPDNPKEYASYILLKDDLLTEKILGTKKYKHLVHNTEFLYKMLTKHGELHCEFCGKPDLRVYHWHEKKDFNKMATADHFLAKSFDYENLAFNDDNLVVCCYQCNNKKGKAVWDISTLKFMYAREKSNTILGQMKVLSRKTNRNI